MKLSYKIGLIIGLSIIGSLLVSSYTVYRATHQNTEITINQNQEETAQQTMDKIDRFLYERGIDTQVMSNNGQFAQNILENTEEHTATSTVSLNNIKTLSGAWDNLAIINASSVVIASTDKSKSNFLKNALVTELYKNALLGQTVSSDVFIDETSSEPTMVFFSPIRSGQQGQKIIGVVGGKLSWPSVLEILATIRDGNLKLLNNTGLELGTNDNDYSQTLQKNFSSQVAFTKLNETNNNTSSLGVHAGFDNKKNYYVSYARESGFLDYKSKGWSIFMFAPEAAVLSPSQRITTELTRGLIIVMLVTLIIVLLFINNQVLKPVKALSFAVESIARGDRKRTVKVTSNDELGKLAGSFNTMQTQLLYASEQLHHEKIRLEASINSLPLGFILTDVKNSIISVNPMLHRIIGIHSEANKTDPTAGIQEKGVDNLRLILDKCELAMNKKHNIVHSFTTGTGRFLHMFISPILEHGKVNGAVALIEDITEAKVMERSKDEFFSIASHELRTPLTAIRGNAKLIEQLYGQEVMDPQFGQMVSDIHSSSVRLISIVNDFLDASKLEQGKIKFTPVIFDITTLLETVSYELSSVINERHIYLKTDKTLKKLPEVFADCNRVKQVAYNLIGNAAKFTDKGGITVHAVDEGDFIRIKIEDTGRGIPIEMQAILFHKFQQAGESLFTRDTTRGTGLGLYISKLFIEQMGGKLQLDWSKNNVGSSFSFTLPKAKKSDTVATKPTTKPPEK